VDAANKSTFLQNLCADIRKTSSLCLREAVDGSRGGSVQVTRRIEKDTPLVYYSGYVSDVDKGGNHCLLLGPWEDHILYLD